jgi:undecaprenyl-diphosphatase
MAAVTVPAAQPSDAEPSDLCVRHMEQHCAPTPQPASDGAQDHPRRTPASAHRWWLPLWFAGLGVALALSAGASATPYYRGDITIARAVQAADDPPMAALVRGVSVLGDTLPTLLLGAVLVAGLVLTRRGNLAAFYLLAHAARSVSDLIKWAVARPRPSASLVAVTDYRPDTSFPSGHALSALLVYGAIMVLVEYLPLPRGVQRLVQALCLVIIVLAGWARVYTGAHWPSDVLGGYLWGAVVLTALVWGMRATGLLPRRRCLPSTTGDDRQHHA